MTAHTRLQSTFRGAERHNIVVKTKQKKRRGGGVYLIDERAYTSAWVWAGREFGIVAEEEERKTSSVGLAGCREELERFGEECRC